MSVSPGEDLKILLFTDTLCDANGVSRFIQDIGKEASKGKKKLYIITSTVKHHCKEEDYIFNTKPIFKIKMPFYPELDLVFPNFFLLLKITKRINPDIIHLSTPGPVGTAGWAISKILKKPRAGIYHTDFPSYLYDNTKSKAIKRATDFVMRVFYSDFKRVFSRSTKYVDVIKNDLKIDDSKIYTLQAGINTCVFHKDFRDLNIWKNYEKVRKDSIKVLYVGRLTKEKNFPFLLEIWERLNTRCELDIQLIVVGEGKFKEMPENYEEKNIVYLGFRGGEELSRIYASSDIFIFPSVTDTLGQVVMEAGSSGLPVIVSNIGGPQIVVNKFDKQSGYILSTNDKNSWVDAIIELASDEHLRKKMGEAGFETIQGMTIESTFRDFWGENIRIVNWDAYTN